MILIIIINNFVRICEYDAIICEYKINVIKYNVQLIYKP